jgi:hypothetical protein
MTEAIKRANSKKQFIENYKKEYQSLIEKNQDNCLEYLKIINRLKSGITIPFGDKYSQEELKLMQKYVLGNDEISICNVLSTEQLRNEPPSTQAQPQQAVDKNIIGYYGQIPVYKYDNSIVVDEKVYLLFLQPLQHAFNNEITKYQGNITTRYFIMYDGKSIPDINDFRNENIIGWVDYDNKNSYTFKQRKGDKVEGVNLFGSLYIGPNNPTYPNGKLIKTLPPQDNVDAAALDHDNCYESKNAAGAKDAFFNCGVVDCDMELVMRCLATLQINIEDNITEGKVDFIKDKLAWGRIPAIKDIRNHEQITDPVQRAKYTATFFLSTSTYKGWGLIMKIVDDEITDYGEREIKKHDLLHEADRKQTVTYDAPTTLVSTSGEKYEVQAGYYFIGTFKDGEIEQGNLYDPKDPQKPVKTFFKKK